MGPRPMIVFNEISKVPVQASFIEHNDISTLPRRARGGQDLFDPHCLDLVDKFFPEDPITISQQVLRRAVPGKGLPELLDAPFRCRMRGDGKVENPSTIVCQHQKHIQDLKPDGRHRKKVNRNHALDVIRKEGLPGLRGRSSPTHHVFAHAGLSDVDSELQKLTVNTRSAPYRVFTAHDPDQLSDLARHHRPAWFAMPYLPGPEQSKALAMPGNHGRCFDDEDAGPPFVPDG